MKEYTVTSQRCKSLLMPYLYFMEEEERDELNLIDSNDIPNHPLFNYAKYLKYLHVDRIITIIKTLLNNDTYFEDSERQVEVILTSLLNIFIKFSKVMKISFESIYQENNSIILSAFSYLKDKNESSFKDFFSNFQEFECSSVYPSNDVFDLFRKHSSNIKSFTITMETPDLFTLLRNSEVGISELISIQHSITELNFQGEQISTFIGNHSIHNLFKSHPNITKSLRKVRISNVIYMSNILLKSADTLEDLEINFSDPHFENLSTIKVTNVRFIKLKYLRISANTFNNEFLGFILNSGDEDGGKGGGLEHISITTWTTRNNSCMLLLDAISLRHYQTLTYLHIPIKITVKETLEKLRDLCELCNKLKFLRFDSIKQSEGHENYSCDILQLLKEYSSLNITKFELMGWWSLSPENVIEFIDYRKSLNCYFKLYIDDLDHFLLSPYINDGILNIT
ncbi:18626_t:CDS:1 [Funneliformis geosporum]|uniref:18626_t:CDS:1 n=1 Tax=Funneliformis geosporum TaxID=1117311 RepID=A0A9W4T0V1_9GLOM|nr:18626_t:CDS:1 [Funneliformis geosporum]